MKSLPAQNPGVRASHVHQPSGTWAAIEHEFRRALSASPMAVLVTAVRGGDQAVPQADVARYLEGCNIH